MEEAVLLGPLQLHRASKGMPRMDVVLKPIRATGKEWSLKDRLGRGLGTITKADHSDSFEIAPIPDGALRSCKTTHTSLDDAMSAIAKLANGACSLDSQDWD